jgi:hypothetical protein
LNFQEELIEQLGVAIRQTPQHRGAVISRKIEYGLHPFEQVLRHLL